jgi:hypothetical protein
MIHAYKIVDKHGTVRYIVAEQVIFLRPSSGISTTIICGNGEAIHVEDTVEVVANALGITLHGDD